MARKSSPTIVQEELYPLPNEVPESGPFDDARLLDLEEEEESPFLRGQKRIAVRRSPIPKKAAIRLKWLLLGVCVLALVAAAGATLYRYGQHSWRFRIDSSDQIEISGAQHVTHAQILEVMGGDIGRNIFFVPLAQRQRQLGQIPWVESASVMRFVPNRLRVEIHERTPVAFARIGSHISLIDAGGTVMELAPGGKHKYSFPVIAGMNAGEPLSTRAARMKNFNELVRQLDSGGARYSKDISEVDLSDPEDVKVLAAGPSGEVLVHLGSGDYLSRYKIYLTHAQQWRQQFDKLESVDLRYDGQIIVNPDLQGMAHQPPLTAAAAKAAMAAGVKPAAIVSYEKYVNRPAAPAPAKKSAKPVGKASARSTVHHTALKPKPAAATVAKNAPAPSHAAAPPGSGKAPDSGTAKAVKPAPSAVAPPAAVAAGQKKPSPAIPKETPQN
ncbi:MAG: cell division protein FtsQ/DivIB [Terriglobales bacterium]